MKKAAHVALTLFVLGELIAVILNVSFLVLGIWSWLAAIWLLNGLGLIILTMLVNELLEEIGVLHKQVYIAQHLQTARIYTLNYCLVPFHPV